MKQANERMCHGRSVFSRIEFMSEGVERIRVAAEVGDVEHGFGVWELQSRKVGI